MAQYIDKDALVAEIERRLGELSQLEKASYEIGLYDAYKIILSFLYTLGVKEVDIKKTLNGFQNFYAHENGGEYPSAIEIAKHFFELGVQVSNKAQKGE